MYFPTYVNDRSIKFYILPNTFRLYIRRCANRIGLHQAWINQFIIFAYCYNFNGSSCWPFIASQNLLHRIDLRIITIFTNRCEAREPPSFSWENDAINKNIVITNSCKAILLRHSMEILWVSANVKMLNNDSRTHSLLISFNRILYPFTVVAHFAVNNRVIFGTEKNRSRKFCLFALRDMNVVVRISRSIFIAITFGEAVCDDGCFGWTYRWFRYVANDCRLLCQ